MNINENIALAVKELRRQASANLALADWLEGLKITETPVQEAQKTEIPSDS